MNGTAWSAVLLSIVATLAVCAIVLEKLVSIAARIKGIEAEQSTQYTRLGDFRSDLHDAKQRAQQRDDVMAGRLDALERRPPVVTVTLQPPAPAPKQGKAVAK